MSKENQDIVPELRFPEFENDPEWKLLPVEEIGNVVASGDLNKKTFSPIRTQEHTIPIYSNSVSNDGLYGFNSTPKYKSNSVTITARGTLGVAFVRKNEFVGIGRLLVVSELEKNDPVFFKENWNHYAQIPLENGGIPQLTAVQAKKAQLYYPDNPKEQQKIADCLSSLDELIEAETEKLDSLKDHKKGLLQQVFPAEGETVPKLRFPEFENDGEWSYLNGDQLFEPISNKNHNSDLPILAITQDKGAIPRDMIDYYVSVSNKSIANYKVVEIGDFVISLRSFQGGIEYSYYHGLCSPAYIILRRKTNILNNDFYRHYFKSFSFIQDLNKNLEGIRDGKMISYKQFSEISVPKPSAEEQHKITNCLTSADKSIIAQSDKIESLKEHKKGLMQQLFPNLSEQE